MISVIVPVFNGEKTIVNCLKSLRRQTIEREQYEIIVVDDGSSDKTVDLVKRFTDVRYAHKKNAGPAAARNFGVREAKGDVLLFIDADCEAEQNWIAEMTKPFADPSVQAVKGVYQTKQKGLVARLVQLEFEERYRRMARAASLDFMDFSAGAIRRSAFQEAGWFDERLRMSEDVQLAYKLSSAGKKIVFAREAIVFHQHPAAFLNYLRLKFWRSFWRMDVYKHFPRKILRDSYTPQTLKLQIVGVFLALLTLCLWPLVPVVKYIMMGEAVILLLLIFPLTLRAFGRGPATGLLMPFFVLGRALALGFGVLYYFLEIKNFRELISFIMLALVVVVPSLFTGGRDLVARTVVFVLAFPILFFVLRAEKEPLKARIPLRFNLFCPLLLFFGIMLLSVILSVSRYDSYSAFLHWLSYLVLFFAVFYLVSSLAEGHKFAYLILFLAVILSVIGLYFFILTEFYSYLRVISTFYQHNPFAGFLLFALPLSFSYLFFEKKKRNVIFLFLMTVLLSLAFVLTHSRGAWLSFAVPFLVIAAVALRQNRRWLFTGLILVLLAGTVAAGWWGLTQLKAYQAKKAAPVGETATTVGYSVETPEENAVTARLHFWQGAKDIFLAHPFFGTGLETYQILYRQYLTDIRYYSIDPHNIYLKILAEMGVVGALPFLWLVGVVLWLIVASLRLLKKLKNDSDRALLLGLGMGLVGALLHNGVELDWQFPTNLIVFFITLGVFYKLFLLERASTTPELQPPTANVVHAKPMTIPLVVVAFLTLVGGLLLFASDTLSQRASVHLNNLESEQAESALQTALKLDPLNYNLHYSLAYAYYYLIPENVDYYKDLYLRELEKIISLSRENYVGYEELGKHYLFSKDYARAEELLSQAVARNPLGKPELYLRLTAASYQRGEQDKTIALLEEAVGHYQLSLKDSVIWIAENKEKILFDISQLHTSLGIMYGEKGEGERAEQQFVEALNYYADNRLAQEYLADITAKATQQP